MKVRESIIVVALLGAATSGAAAQWESPTYFSPRPHDDIGAYVVDGERRSAGFVGIWRQTGNLNLGLRGGIAPGGFDWLLGVETFGPLDVLGPASPVSTSWIVSAGAMFGGEDNVDLTWVRIPAGLSIGMNLESGNVTIVPYAHPRVAFDLLIVSADGDDDTDSEVNFDLDLGADVLFGQNFVLRGGVTLTNDTRFGAGIAYRIPRRAVVR